jgi:hypothetical protein
MRPPRMTIPRWLTAVAVAAGTLALVVLSPRAEHLRAKAAYHARKEREAIDILDDPRGFRGAAVLSAYRSPEWYAMGGSHFRLIEEAAAQLRASWQRVADYHAAMRRKYERAALFPLLPVEPDPPEP